MTFYNLAKRWIFRKSIDKVVLMSGILSLKLMERIGGFYRWAELTEYLRLGVISQHPP
jgi:hypothetical protein